MGFAKLKVIMGGGSLLAHDNSQDKWTEEIVEMGTF